jgi:hypothetical protein
VLAYVHLSAGRKKEAGEECDAALALNPEDPLALKVRTRLD